MAEPVTAASIALIVGKEAATQFGKEIAKALAGKLFAKDDSSIRESLANLDKKLSETLNLARSIHAMVLELPALIERKELDSRHAELAGVEANFRSARRWTEALAGSARTEFSSAWMYIVTYEFRMEALAKLPRFGEVGIGISRGELHPMILDGIDQRIDHNSRMTQSYRETIALAAATIEAALASPYVKEGELIHVSPWATWAMNGPRTMIITDHVWVRNSDPVSGGYDMPIRREVEDIAWRDGLSSTREVLSAQRKKLEEAMQGLHACLYLNELLKSYRKVLVGRKRS